MNNNMNNNIKKDGNKLPLYYDDPVDIYYKNFIDIINPYFTPMKI